MTGGAPDTRLRVVYLDHVARLSGGELALANTLPALLDRVDPLVVLAESGPLEARLAASGIATLVVPLGDDIRDLRRNALSALRLGPALRLARYVWRLSRLIRAEHADLVHTNSLKSALYGGVAGRLAGVPVVWHIRDRIARDYLPAPVVVLVRLLARVLPSAVIANSQTTRQTLPALHAEVLSGPVFDASAGAGSPPAARPDRPDLRIGLVGRLSPWKGQDLFLRAFAAAFPAGDQRAVIIGSAMFGEDDYADSLPILARELGIAGRVEFLGFRDDVAAELAELNILVHCSTTPEPFGQVVLEGLLAGLPVIAPAEGGPSEIITSGVDGLLVAPRDVDALSAALVACAGDSGLRRRLGEAGFATAARYTPESTAAGLMMAYRAVMARRAR